jgi:Zn-dependent protease with chaperone function
MGKEKNNVPINERYEEIFKDLKKKLPFAKETKLVKFKGYPCSNKATNTIYMPFIKLAENEIRFTLLHEFRHLKNRKKDLTLELITAVVLALVLATFYFCPSYILALKYPQFKVLIDSLAAILFVITYFYILLVFIGKERAKEEELSADSWAAEEMVRLYNIHRPSEALKSMLYNYRHMDIQLNAKGKIFDYFINKTTPYLPDKERVDRIRKYEESLKQKTLPIKSSS